ncbi:MAG: hypothetical protein P8J45_05605 [Phycisphaerales bacterium]|nr:hypothetical protein [Phycisphaerales bacterium]
MEIVVCPLVIVIMAWFFLGMILPLTRRAQEDACPTCKHPTHGLVHPVCPECGQDLTNGIQAADQMTGFWRSWLGTNIVLASLCLGLFAVSCSVVTAAIRYALFVSMDEYDMPQDDTATFVVETILWSLLPIALLVGSVLLFIWGMRVIKNADRLKPFKSAGIIEPVPVPEPNDFQT